MESSFLGLTIAAALRGTNTVSKTILLLAASFAPACVRMNEVGGLRFYEFDDESYLHDGQPYPLQLNSLNNDTETLEANL